MATTPESSGRVAVVSGAGSGIGRAVARLMLAEGYRVVLADRRELALQETAAGHAQTVVVPCDVTASDDVERLFAAAFQRWGRVDVLFNNAGVFGPSASVDEISLLDGDAAVTVNLTGSMLCAAAAVRAMKAQSPQGGRIIDNGSIAAHAPLPRTVAYTVTKHAMTGLAKSIELDGRGSGITCGQIDICNTATDLMESIGVASGTVQADGSRKVEPTFPVEEAARTVLLMAGVPPSASVGSVIITAAGMPFIGGDRPRSAVGRAKCELAGSPRPGGARGLGGVGYGGPSVVPEPLSCRGNWKMKRGSAGAGRGNAVHCCPQ